MFCFQCQEALNNKGCTVAGVCGKDSITAELQDLLIHETKRAAMISQRARKSDISRDQEDLIVAENLFTTVTNVNFDPKVITGKILKTREYSEDLIRKIEDKGEKFDLPEALTGALRDSRDALAEEGRKHGVLVTENEDIRSLRELLIYGLKGIAAYVDHAYVLRTMNDEILDFIDRALASTADDDVGKDELIALILEAGKFSVEAMALLDKANTGSYGDPVITEVWTGVEDAPGIIVSGHDLLDLEELLKQSEGSGVNIYTHGEMLPANAYPALKKYTHLKGNYGTSWYNQQKEFAAFNGPVLMTTNCIQKPLASYADRIYTTGLVAWPGTSHITGFRGTDKDFTPIIEHAKKLGSAGARSGKKIVIGFGRNTLMENAQAVLDAVSKGHIKRFFVMSGCDGRHKERDYYTEFAKALPEDAVILTSGCAKYRYNMLELGDIGGIPRVIDAGQCNDSYSLAYLALQLKEILKVDDINDLPISFNVAWYEQKAVAVLLALLYLGFKGIRLGPTLPAFLSPNVAKVLMENFDIRPISTVKKDMEAMLAGD